MMKLIRSATTDGTGGSVPKKMRVASRRTAMVFSTVALALACTATAAHAAADVYHGEDHAWSVFTPSRTVYVADNECDGNHVTVEVNLTSGNYQSFSDANGCSPGASFENTWDGSYVDSIRICENTRGCSAWKDS
jgi:hypothetical protein